MSPFIINFLMFLLVSIAIATIELWSKYKKVSYQNPYFRIICIGKAVIALHLFFFAYAFSIWPMFGASAIYASQVYINIKWRQIEIETEGRIKIR